jgi:predicted nucleic acid-binding protein
VRRALLDTDIFSEVAKGKNETVRRRALAYTATIGPLAISTVTVVEVVKGLRAEAVGEVGPILQRLELRLGEGVVVRDAGPRVVLRDAEVGEEQGQRLRGHRCPAVGVNDELPSLDLLPLAGVADELARQDRALTVGEKPADDVAAEDVDQDVQIEVRPLLRPEQLRLRMAATLR